MRPDGLDRRSFLTLGVGALAVAALPASLRRPRALVRRRIPVMGTVAEVALPGPDGPEAQRAIDAAFGALRRVEATMTRFRQDSEVGRLNTAGCGWRPISGETATVLGRAGDWAAASEGRFDPCLGMASELWDATRHDAPPPREALRHLAGASLWTALEVESDGTAARARLFVPEARLDLGGIAKGFGVDAAAAALRAHGRGDGLVNVGGDLVALGTDASGDPWRIGIRSPESADEIVETLEVSDAAVATSGDYLRYFEHGGRRYHHLLDPGTGEPARTATRSLTVQAACCLDADAAATALFAVDPAGSDRILRRAGSDATVVHRIQEVIP
jgi:thiamine biosynthesis lipoprotein